MSEEGKAPKVEVGLFPGMAEVAKDVVKDLAKPIYEQGLSPAVIQVGKTLETAARAVNTVLIPLRIAVLHAELFENGIARKLVQRNVEEVQTPAPNVIGPSVDALRYNSTIPELREMFLGLIATSMDKQNSEAAHPYFVEIIKQLSPTEARILEVLFREGGYATFVLKENSRDDAGRYEDLARESACRNVSLMPAFLENLDRLGLAKVFPSSGHLESPTFDREDDWDKLLTSAGGDLLGRPGSKTRARLKEWIDGDPERHHHFPRNGGPAQEGEIVHTMRKDIVIGQIVLTQFGRLMCEATISTGD